MDESQRLTWFAGLFEGEGTFRISNGKPKGLTIQMTDLDVLLRVQEFFGGSIYECKKREEHWKDSWRWSLCGQPAIDLAHKIRPFLLSRRTSRCDDFTSTFRSLREYNDERKANSASLREMVRELRACGMTHKEIANVVGRDRTYITHILNGRLDT